MFHPHSHNLPYHNCLNKSILEAVKILIPKREEMIRMVEILNNRMAQIEMMKKETEKQKKVAKDIFLSYLKNIFESDLLKDYPKEKLKDLTTKIGS